MAEEEHTTHYYLQNIGKYSTYPIMEAIFISR